MAKVKVLVQQSGVSIRYWAVTETGCKAFRELKSILTTSYEDLRDMFVGSCLSVKSEKVPAIS